MLFNSYVFILAFLPVTVCIYFLLNHFHWNKASQVFLIGMSLLFYGYFNPMYLWIICSSIIVNYGISQLLNMSNQERIPRKPVMVIGILFNVGLIFYFKYFDFFIANVNAAFQQSFELQNIVLPLGISFFTFQQISYMVDSYRGETKDYGFVEYALFVSFFPQLVAGPIVLHNEMIPQFKNEENRRMNADHFARGLWMFAIGLFKKVLVADTFGKAVTWGFGNIVGLTSFDALIVMLAYTIQIYFDFSGYCDMASGIAWMFNIKLPMNFNSPYKATSIVEFWQRWHITLTRFLRQYIYFPLGGNRRGNLRTYVNIIIVFLVSGIWHGANWTFIVWGLLHGVANALTRRFQKGWNRLHTVMQWLLTFGFVSMTWMIFRADNLQQGCQFLSKLVLVRNTSITPALMQQFVLPECTWLENTIGAVHTLIANYMPGFWMWGLLVLALMVILNFQNIQEKVFRPTWKSMLLTSIMLVWSIFSLSGVSTFLYFNF